MELSEGPWNDIEQDQIIYWLKKATTPAASYIEPKLNEATVELVKLVCEIFNQTDEVFITSVDILEDYLNAKRHQNIEIHDSILSMVCAVLITSKLVGSHSEIKIVGLQTVIKKLTNKEVDRNIIIDAELDMLLTLGIVPLRTTAYHVGMFLGYYLRNLNLQVTDKLQTLCLQLLNIVYIHRKKLFFELKSFYSQNETTLEAFKQLLCNRIYLPGGILLCALRITKLKNSLDLKQVAQDIEEISSIHYDHLQLLAGTIFEFLEI